MGSPVHTTGMVQVDIVYQGDLRCQATHGPSGGVIHTDAPLDNHGKGEAFSPTDLVGTALGTCMLTIMGIVAQRHGLDLRGTTVKVTKEMVAQPHRRIGRLGVTFNFVAKFSDEDKQRLEQAAYTCPVHRSLSKEVEIPIVFNWA